MLLTPHTMVGIAIGAAVPNIFVAVPLAFAMHFAGDLIPHWDIYEHFPDKTELFNDGKALIFFGDILLGITFGLAFTLHALWVDHSAYLALKIFLCGLASVLPDAMYAPIVFNDSKNRVFRFFYKLQGKIHSHADIRWGNITQVIVTVAAFLVSASLLAR